MSDAIEKFIHTKEGRTKLHDTKVKEGRDAVRKGARVQVTRKESVKVGPNRGPGATGNDRHSPARKPEGATGVLVESYSGNYNYAKVIWDDDGSTRWVEKMFIEYID